MTRPTITSDFNFFDAEDLAYRYAITAIENESGAVDLVEFRRLD